MTRPPLRAGHRAGWLIFAALFALVPLLAIAQDTPPANAVASSWYMWPKTGHAEQFEKAISGYAAWRKRNGESFDWQVFQPVAGDDMAHYVVRSGGHAWADFDANRRWEIEARADAAFWSQVGPHVDRYSHYLTQDEDDLSYWNATDPFPMYEVTTLQLGPGQYGNFRRAVSRAREAAKAQKWKANWGMSAVTGGGDDMILVLPYRSYAEMAGPSPSFIEMMASQLGGQAKAAEALAAIQSAIHGSSTTVYVHREDLSTPPK
jgi:hypothetical protein